MYHLLYFIMMGSLVGPTTLIESYPSQIECQNHTLDLQLYVPPYIDREQFEVFWLCTDKLPHEIIDLETGELLMVPKKQEQASISAGRKSVAPARIDVLGRHTLGHPSASPNIQAMGLSS